MDSMFYSPSTGGFYTVSIHGSQMPADAIDVGEQDYDALMMAQSWGQIIQPNPDGYPIAVDPPAPSLDALRQAAQANIDTAAEAQRLRHLTPGAGQMMVYQEKQAEAGALIAAVASGQTVEATAFPHLSAEVGITADTLEGVARVILAMKASWAEVSAQIEKVRLRAKHAIDDADTAAAIQAAEAAVVWP